MNNKQNKINKVDDTKFVKENKPFEIVTKFKLTKDQERAVNSLVDGIKKQNLKYQVVLGATGTGKTFTMANVIAALNKPTLIISHNKTLAGQLYGEMKEYFPENAVEYFVSYSANHHTPLYLVV